MKPVVLISSPKTIMLQVLGLFVFIAIASTISSIFRGDSTTLEVLQAAFWGTIILVIVSLLMYLFILRGRFLAVSEAGLRMGKRYAGPYSSASQISAHTFPRHRPNELFVPWDQIEKISFGIWERFWARHLGSTGLASSHISGDIDTVSQKFIIPTTNPKMRAFYLIVRTRRNEFYVFNMNARISQLTKNTIQKFGHGDLIDSQAQKL